MVMRRNHAQAMAEGREAMLSARLAGRPRPVNPYRSETVKARYFDWGAERTARLFDQIMEIGR